MDPNFSQFLLAHGITHPTIAMIEKEDVYSMATFESLNEGHLQKLIPCMKIGQHAILLQLWKERTSSLSFSTLQSRRSMSLSDTSASASPSHSASGDSVEQNIKELTELYKARSKFDSKGKDMKTKKQDPRKVIAGLFLAIKCKQIILGGMFFDHSTGKGIKRRCIASANPSKVEFFRRASIYDVFTKAKELYFDESSSIENMHLADSNGLIIHVAKEKWNLQDYYDENQYKYSRHKLYVVLDDEKDLTENDIFDSDSDCGDDNNPKTPYKDGVSSADKNGAGPSKRETSVQDTRLEKYTLPKITSCMECGGKFRTYIPDTHCLMPDGSTQLHVDPQDLCPECDPAAYGLFLNEDLYPHLVIHPFK